MVQAVSLPQPGRCEHGRSGCPMRSPTPAALTEGPHTPTLTAPDSSEMLSVAAVSREQTQRRTELKINLMLG